MIGHHAYLSPYLKKKTKGTRLDTIVNFGRILKVKSKTTSQEIIPDLSALNGAELIELLKHKNGWIRSRAQHHLIFKNEKDVLPKLKALALNTNNELAQIHALYALEGLEALDFDFLAEVAKSDSSKVIAHALILMDAFATEENGDAAKNVFTNLMQRDNLEIDLYLSSSIGMSQAFCKPHSSRSID